MSPSQRMTNADAAWLHMDRPTNLMVVNGALWFDEPLDFERLRAVVASAWSSASRASTSGSSSRGRLGGPSWEDDPDFDLDLHLHHIALPAPGDRAALQELVADLRRRRSTAAKPLWDMYLVDGYGSGTAILTRMHHCIADGIALARVLLSLTDAQPEAGSARGAGAPRRRGQRSVGDLFAPARGARSAARRGRPHPRGGRARDPPSWRPRRRRATMPSRGEALLSGSDRARSCKGELGVAERVAWSDPIPLDDVKAVGHATGTTVNDVLVAAMAGALRSYLAERDSLVDEIHAWSRSTSARSTSRCRATSATGSGSCYLPVPVGVADPRRAPARRSTAVWPRSRTRPRARSPTACSARMGVTPAAVEQRLLDLFSAKARP